MPARRINPAGLSLVKEFEGLRLQAYRDTGGVWTVGFGHTGPDVKPGMLITATKAEQLLRDDLAEAESAVAQFVTVPLNDNQFAALVSFTFNVGREAFRRSTLRKRLNAGDYAAVPGQLARWVHDNGRKINGLVRRRQAEADLWNTPFVASEVPTSFPSPQEPPKREPRPGTTYDGLEVHDPARPTSTAKQGGIALAVVGVIAALAAWLTSLPCDLLGILCK